MRIAVLIAPVLLMGCATMKLSEDRLARETALALNVQPNEVRISDLQNVGSGTKYYSATIGSKKYRCSIFGGGLMTMGMTNPPQCKLM